MISNHQEPPPPPPPLRPPPKPPKPPKPPPKPPPRPNPPNPPPNGPTPLDHPPPPPQPPRNRRRPRMRPAMRLTMTNSDDERHDQAATRSRLRARAVAVPANTLKRDIAPLGDPAHDSRRARKQPLSVVTAPEGRDHLFAARLAREAVGDERLELVSDLDAHLPILDRQRESAARCRGPARRSRGRGSRTSSPRTRGCRRRARTCRSWRPPRRRRSPAGATGSATPSSRAFAASMTFAKSLTGCVSSGGSSWASAAVTVVAQTIDCATAASQLPPMGVAGRDDVDISMRAIRRQRVRAVRLRPGTRERDGMDRSPECRA